MQLPASDTNARNSEEMDLKKHAACSYPDDMTDATVFTSMSSLTDSMTVISTSTRSRRGSILKSPSTSKPKLDFPKRRSRISFSTTANQVFPIENKEEYYEDLFYDQESLADFRYEALMWQTGMVDENGTPVSVIQSASETYEKYEHLDDLNGSLDFDELLLDELKTSDRDNPLEDTEQDKGYSRDAIRERRKSIDGNDQQWKSTADIFSNIAGWDDDFDDIESVAGDDELNDDLDSPFTTLNADVPNALSSKEKFYKQRRQLSFHKKTKQLLDNGFNLEQDDVFSLEPSDDGSRDDNSQRSERLFPSERDSSSQRSQRSLVNELDSRLTQSTSHVYEVDDSQRTQSTVVGDTSDQSHLCKKLEKRDSVRQSLQSLSDVFLSSSSQHGDSGASLDHISSHSAGDKRSRLMAKMRGLRESLRSIQDLEDIDSDDDSEWGDEKDDGAENVGLDPKNLKHSLIVKHLLYSPVPNQARGMIERLESVKEMTIPELRV